MSEEAIADVVHGDICNILLKPDAPKPKVTRIHMLLAVACHVCVCVCVCMYVCMYVSMYVCVYTHARTHT